MGRSNIEESKKYMVSGTWIKKVEDFMENLTYCGRPLRSNGPGADIAPSPFEMPPVVCVPTCDCSEDDPVWREKECDDEYEVHHYVADVYDKGTSGEAPVTKVLSSFSRLSPGTPVLASYHLMTSNEGKPVHKLVALGAGGASSSVPAKIAGAPSDGVYPVDIYAAGVDGGSTETGEVQIVNISPTEVVPPGTWIIAHPCQITITGGGEA